jgi:type 1 fimbriae regulatory protein FimB
MTGSTIRLESKRGNMKQRKNQVAALTPEQLAKVLAIAKEKSPRDHAMILVQYFHALRASELVSLTLADLDRRQKVWFLTVSRLKGSLETRQNVWEVKGKPVWNEFAALRDYLDNRGNPPTDALFVSQKQDGSLDRSVWNRIFKGYAKQAGLPVTLQHNHCLRHSRAKHLLSASSSLDHVRQSLGHSSLNSTIIYTSTTDQEADVAARDALKLLP